MLKGLFNYISWVFLQARVTPLGDNFALGLG